MYYTLADFMENNTAPDLHLVTKKSDFSKIQVKSASVQELPLENFVQENEIIMSTGIGCDEDPQCFMRLVQEAGRAKASAIIFSFRNENLVIPDEVIAYADSILLPIFTLPWSYRFAPIQYSILDGINSKELTVYQKVQNTLFDYFTEGKSLRHAAEYISEIFDCTVKITDPSGTVMEECIKNRDDSVHNDGTVTKAMTDILIGNALFGHLSMEADAPEENSDKHTLLLRKYVAFPLSLWFNRTAIENMTMARLKNDFVWNIAAGNNISYEEMLRESLYLQFDLSKPYTCLVMQTEFKDIPEYSDLSVRNAARIENLLTQEAQRLKLSIMSANMGLKFIIYLENAVNSPEKVIKNYIEKVETQMYREYPFCRSIWGISETFPSKTDFQHLYKEASLALQYCMNERGRKRYFTYKDTKKALIVSTLAAHPEIREKAEETLIKILEYDEASKTGLLRTLTEYIRTNYNISQTARNLHIHRQSLIYRLKKIEDMTNMSLDSHDDLFVLESFSRIYRLY